MGKILYHSFFKTAVLSAALVSVNALAEDIFVDCTNGANNPECAAVNAAMPAPVLYAEAPVQDPYAGTSYAEAPMQVVYDENAPINATPDANFAMPGSDGANVQQVLIRDTAEPLSVSQPIDELEEAGEEYAFYKTDTGSLIVESQTTHQEGENGATIQVRRKTETTVTPAYVEMPSISEHQRAEKVAESRNVSDWEAENGDSLRGLLIEWGQKSGWTVVWKLDRDYILEAGVVFRGTFTEVASAIIRTFARANPAPIGTFYKGNRVLVINTQEDDNA